MPVLFDTLKVRGEGTRSIYEEENEQSSKNEAKNEMKGNGKSTGDTLSACAR